MTPEEVKDRAQCPFCFRQRQLRQDGTFPKHAIRTRLGHKDCPGSELTVDQAREAKRTGARPSPPAEPDDIF